VFPQKSNNGTRKRGVGCRTGNENEMGGRGSCRAKNGSEWRLANGFFWRAVLLHCRSKIHYSRRQRFCAADQIFSRAGARPSSQKLPNAMRSYMLARILSEANGMGSFRTHRGGIKSWKQQCSERNGLVRCGSFLRSRHQLRTKRKNGCKKEHLTAHWWSLKSKLKVEGGWEGHGFRHRGRTFTSPSHYNCQVPHLRQTR